MPTLPVTDIGKIMRIFISLNDFSNAEEPPVYAWVFINRRDKYTYHTGTRE